MRRGIVIAGATLSMVAAFWACAPASRGEQPEAAVVFGAESDAEQPPLTTLGTIAADLRAIGGRPDLTSYIGQHVETEVDFGRNDVAAWTGTPPDTLLMVFDRDTRTSIDRVFGLPSEHDLVPPPRGRVTVRGVIEPLPYAEAMYSWGLTRRDVALLAERKAYLRVYTVVSELPGLAPPLSAEAVDEWGRETAPPPGHQVETPLHIPPPLP